MQPPAHFLRAALGPLGLLALLGGGVASSGCGAGAEQQRLGDELSAARRELRIVTDALEAQRRSLQGMDDRLALLEDRVEAAAYGAQAWRRLPMVRLEPEEQPVAAPEDPTGSAEESYTITQADLDAVSPIVESEGGGGGRRLPRQPVEPPENAAMAGNIGVIEMPPTRRSAGEGRQAQVQVNERSSSALDQPAQQTAAGATGRPTRAGEIDPIMLSFREGRERYAQGDLGGAIQLLTAFAQRHPDHDFADNALVLVGRCRYERAEYAAALNLFRQVIERYPTGNKVPEALLMIGRTQIKLGRPAEGRETLSRLVSMYPDGEAARAAATDLDRASRRM